MGTHRRVRRAAGVSEVELAELEVMVGSGRYTEAIELGRLLSNRATTPRRSACISFHLATAHLLLGRMRQAEGLLDEARAGFEAVDDTAMVAECLGTQAALTYMTQRPGAVAMAERALELCRSLKPVPAATESRLLYVLAGARMTNEELDQAISGYLAAIKAAGPLVDLRRLAKMYGDLGGAYRVKGDLEAAVRYASRSVQVLITLGDKVSLARSENNLGLVLMARGDLVGARMHLDRSLQLCQETDLQAGRSHVLLSLCELCVEQRDIDHASDFARDALELAERLGEPLNMAEAHIWLGRVADRRGDDAAVDREFERAFTGLEQVGVQEKLVQSHAAYAVILERRGDLSRAYVHMKKALQESRPGLLGRERDEAKVSTA